METISDILQKHWGFSKFRPLQEEIINSVLDGNDTLALLPTGGGKSLCYQVPAMAMDGLCLVISPLIALMKDQVENLRHRNIRAATAYSGMSRKEINLSIENCVHGNYKFLYVSPERLGTEHTKDYLKQMKINLVAVDEAHCISQWGYDFRPAYMEIAAIKEILPSVPILALTATATKQVRTDICDKLKFKKQNIVCGSFERKNISYVVFHAEDKIQRIQNILGKVDGTGIIYVRSRAHAQELTKQLKSFSVRADFYHAGLDNATRSRKQDEWKKGKTRVIVATNAFGMGIDKPDVRTVIHYEMPDNIEAYYQEAGRAGRDEKRSYAVLLYNKTDINGVAKRAEQSFPAIKEIRNIAQALANYYQIPVGAAQGESFPFDISHFCNTYRMNAVVVLHALKILEAEGYIYLSEAVALPSRIHFPVSHEQLYNLRLSNPRFDSLIKVLLRLYGGVFDRYTNISEEEIAGKMNAQTREVIELLEKLQGMSAVNYVPRSDQPRVTFMKPREDARYINISREHLHDRRKRFEERAHAMFRYSEAENICRSKMLLEYLGEENASDCGTCDVCIRKKKSGLSEIEFTAVTATVENMLRDNPLPLSKLLGTLANVRDEQAIQVVQWMLDHEKIRYTSGDVIEISHH